MSRYSLFRKVTGLAAVRCGVRSERQSGWWFSKQHGGLWIGNLLPDLGYMMRSCIGKENLTLWAHGCLVKMSFDQRVKNLLITGP